jgi:hypothetical protein
MSATAYLPLYGVAGVDFTASEVKEQIANLKGATPVVRLNSGGGITSEALVIAELIKAYPGETRCSLEGAVAGPSLAIAWSCKKVHATPGTWASSRRSPGISATPSRWPPRRRSWTSKLTRSPKSSPSSSRRAA